MEKYPAHRRTSSNQLPSFWYPQPYPYRLPKSANDKNRNYSSEIRSGGSPCEKQGRRVSEKSYRIKSTAKARSKSSAKIIPRRMRPALVMPRPQFGHARALLLTSLPQSGQSFNAIEARLNKSSK